MSLLGAVFVELALHLMVAHLLGAPLRPARRYVRSNTVHSI